MIKNGYNKWQVKYKYLNVDLLRYKMIMIYVLIIFLFSKETIADEIKICKEKR